MINDMSLVIVPKSDQISADDFISGPMTYVIDHVEIRPGTEQPVSIFLAGKPRVWKPCKSMNRVMVLAWGPDANAYKGRSVTLYRDPTVKWGGMDVGGIRISHLSDIKSEMNMNLTATKGKRAPFKVRPLKPAEFDARAWATSFRAKLHEYDDAENLRQDYAEHSDKLSGPARKFMDDAVDERANELGIPADDEESADLFPGDQ